MCAEAAENTERPPRIAFAPFFSYFKPKARILARICPQAAEDGHSKSQPHSAPSSVLSPPSFLCFVTNKWGKWPRANTRRALGRLCSFLQGKLEGEKGCICQGVDSFFSLPLDNQAAAISLPLVIFPTLATHLLLLLNFLSLLLIETADKYIRGISSQYCPSTLLLANSHLHGHFPFLIFDLPYSFPHFLTSLSYLLKSTSAFLSPNIIGQLRAILESSSARPH